METGFPRSELRDYLRLELFHRLGLGLFHHHREYKLNHHLTTSDEDDIERR